MLDHLKLKLKLGISLPVQVLITELISRRAANALNCRAISPVPNGFYIKGWSESQNGFVILKMMRKVKIPINVNQLKLTHICLLNMDKELISIFSEGQISSTLVVQFSAHILELFGFNFQIIFK